MAEMKGRKTTKEDNKRGSGEWVPTGKGAEADVALPPALLRELTAAVTAGRETARVRTGIGRKINLGRLDPGYKYESVRYDCSVELPCAATPGALMKTLDLSKEICEGEVNAYIDELEKQLS